MSHDHSHTDLLSEFAAELQPLLKHSDQAIYVYLDDEAKVCNEKFASLLGYGSAKEWAEMEGNFPTLFVDEGSQEALIGAYQDAMQKMTASTIKVSWKRKSGGSVASTVTLVPMSFQGHLFAVHFVS
jgi:hypothetical protein